MWGNILHEVMETCLSEDRWDTKFINDEIDDVTLRKLPDLLKIDSSVEEVTAKVRERAVGLEMFSKRYIGKKPKVWRIQNYFLQVVIDILARRNRGRTPRQEW